MEFSLRFGSRDPLPESPKWVPSTLAQVIEIDLNLKPLGRTAY